MLSRPGEFHILPYPLPVAPGEPAPGGEPRPIPAPPPTGGARPLPPDAIPGAPGRVTLVPGTSGDDRLTLQPGEIAFGGGGNDVFVLTSAGTAAGSERLGFITDFGEGDTLDLSRLGPNAQALAREESPFAYGPDRIGIDYDGDGDEDGFVLVASGRAPDPGDFRPMPMPAPRALPYGEAEASAAGAGAPSVVSISFSLVEGWA